MLFDFSLIGFLYVTVVPILLFSLLPKTLGAKNNYRYILGLACFLFFVSFFLPSPLIEGRDTQASRHLIGGGLFTGVLWLYIKKATAWRAAWWVEGATLFALVSSLGVLNELYEILLYKLGPISYIGDTSWDLLANTLGAAGFFVVYKLLTWQR